MLRQQSFTTPAASRSWYEYDSLDYRYVLKDAKPRFERLAKFDFRTFSWPPKEPPATTSASAEPPAAPLPAAK